MIYCVRDFELGKVGIFIPDDCLMKQCPICKKKWLDTFTYCRDDGHALMADDPTTFVKMINGVRSLLARRGTSELAKIGISGQDNLIGTLFDNKYEILQKIGQGGMGKVYQAKHTYLGRIVAIKVLNSDLSSDHKALERFQQEARAASAIQHKNIVKIFDFGVTSDSNTAYIAMEYLEGISLRKAIDRSGSFDCERIYFILRQICSALEAAKRLGIIHRDLKPDNIWLEDPYNPIPHVKVLDFGLAKLKETDEKSALTEKGTILGTCAYMSPEQWQGQELDFRSDLYSLGVILYEMLTGQVPFKGSNPMEIGFKHVHYPPRRPSDLIKIEHFKKSQSIPDGIEQVVFCALGKTKEVRQESALHLLQQYETALRSSGLYIPVYWEEKNKGSGWPFNPIGTAGSKPLN